MGKTEKQHSEQLIPFLLEENSDGYPVIAFSPTLAYIIGNTEASLALQSIFYSWQKQFGGHKEFTKFKRSITSEEKHRDVDEDSSRTLKTFCEEFCWKKDKAKRILNLISCKKGEEYKHPMPFVSYFNTRYGMMWDVNKEFAQEFINEVYKQGNDVPERLDRDVILKIAKEIRTKLYPQQTENTIHNAENENQEWQKAIYESRKSIPECGKTESDMAKTGYDIEDIEAIEACGGILSTVEVGAKCTYLENNSSSTPSKEKEKNSLSTSSPTANKHLSLVSSPPATDTKPKPVIQPETDYCSFCGSPLNAYSSVCPQCKRSVIENYHHPRKTTPFRAWI